MTTVIIIGIIVCIIWFVSKMNKTNSYNQTNYNTYTNQHIYLDESYKDLFEDLTLQQRYAIMMMYILIAGIDSTGRFDNSIEGRNMKNRVQQLLGVTLRATTNYVKEHGFEYMKSILSSINDKTLSEFLMIDYINIITSLEKRVDKEKAFATMVHLYEYMGYTEEDITDIIQKTTTIMEFYSK